MVLVPPLFDEANRMRRTLVLTMRALAAHGLTAMLPDLPGQGDSIEPTEAATVAGWRAALSAMAIDGPAIVASWRGGALIDDAFAAIGWWRMAPATGATLVKALLRTRLMGDKEAGRPSTADSLRADIIRDGAGELAGNRISAALLAELDAAGPAAVTPLRQVQPADVGASPLWLRAEPGEDREMAQGMADDIATWARTCAAG